MANNTLNPMPSSNPLDFFDNSENLDLGMNSTAETFLDRFGRPRNTYQAFHNLVINAKNEVGPTVTAAKAAVNAARDEGVQDIGQSVAAVDAAETTAIAHMEETAANLGDDLNNKRYTSYAAMNADPQTREAVVAVVDGDPDANLNGWYFWNNITKKWVRFTNQPARLLDITPRKRPLGPVTGEAPMIWSIGNMLLTLPVQKKRPLGPDLRQGAFLTMGDTVVQPVEARKRPLTEAYQQATLFLSGESVMMQSGDSAVVVPTVTYDAKLIQEQNEKPAPKAMAGLVDGQVWEYGPQGSRQLTSVGTWLAAQAVAFDMVKALKSNGSAPQPHSITKDGRILRDGNVLFHKLVTGQSLALGSRGIILDPNGTIVIDGKTGRLFTPYTLAGYADKLFTLPGGPRPTSWVGATAFDPIREYAAGVAAETPASSYMLAYRRWHERTSSIDPRMLYSISAVGGTAYAGLKKGSTTYTNAMAHVTAAKAIADANGWDYQVPSLSIVHGESQISTTQAEYVAMLAEWISDYRTDIVAITGQAVPPVAFISQMLTGETGTIPAIPLAQLQAHNENPNIVMVGPKYAYGHFDTYHLLADGYAKMGELEARAERLTQVSGKWQPLKVLSASVSGSTITLKMNNLPNGNAGTPGPIGGLVIDTETVKDPGNAGFLLSAGTITSIAVGADGATLVIGTAAAVTAGTVLTYALQPSLSSPQNGSGRRGCIRDTDLRDLSRFDNKPLYNWLCAFSMELQ
ncbi:hypothetical protein [Pseudomonas sp. GTC 16482]|uniref:hypothetical protein n=1 Tax=Pseudomonas sp. GTC 16482 TaxID=1661693 RepID=UPI00076169E9|nr:hypothetical protein [Pseudomonas sp. GTC 16482]